MIKNWRMRYLPLIICFGLSACQADRTILSSLDENEANEIIVVLKQAANIDVDKIKVEGRTITYELTVSAGKAEDALKILVDNHLPRRKSPGFEAVYPLGSGGLIPTQSHEKAKFLMAQQGELETTLKTLPGVVRARVAIVIPEASVIRDKDAPIPMPSASVAIVYNQSNQKKGPPIPVSQVQNLIAYSVEGLDSDRVSVVMTENMPLALLSTNHAKMDRGTLDSTPEREALSEEPSGSDSKGTGLIWLLVLVSIVSLAIGVFGILRGAKNNSGAPTPQSEENDTLDEEGDLHVEDSATGEEESEDIDLDEVDFPSPKDPKSGE